MLPFGPFVFDPDRRLLLREGERVKLTPKAFDLLAILIERRPNAVSKEDLYEMLWPETFVQPASLDALVAKIRTALDDSGRESRYVRTAYGFGFAFDIGDTPKTAVTPARLRLVFISEQRTIHLQP